MPGAGLGNLLFPISRAVIARETLGGTLILPTMRQIKFGPILRKERDKRIYNNIFRHRTASEMRDWSIARIRRNVAENESLSTAGSITRVYSGLGRQFHDLADHSLLVRNFLESHSRLPVPNGKFQIAVHVRLGDFSEPSTGAASQNTRVPLEWYRHAVEHARELLGNKVSRGILFTDDDPHRVIEALGLEGFIPEPPGNALTSILRLGQADILVGSRSTFSLWGRYLGAQAAIWPSGFNLERYSRVDPNNDIFL